MQKVFGTIGLIAAAALTIVCGYEFFAIGAIALNDETYPTCRWFAGDCREIYVNWGEVMLSGMMFSMPLACFSTASLKGKYR